MSTALGKLLRELRGKKSLREAAEIAGVSHNYLSIVEKGKDPRSGAPVSPSPETLKKLAAAYHHSYDHLMAVAGYTEENKTESTYGLSDSQIDSIIKEAEAHYSVNLHDDPVVLDAMKQLIESLAKMKQGK